MTEVNGGISWPLHLIIASAITLGVVPALSRRGVAVAVEVEGAQGGCVGPASASPRQFAGRPAAMHQTPDLSRPAASNRCVPVSWPHCWSPRRRLYCASWGEIELIGLLRGRTTVRAAVVQYLLLCPPPPHLLLTSLTLSVLVVPLSFAASSCSCSIASSALPTRSTPPHSCCIHFFTGIPLESFSLSRPLSISQTQSRQSSTQKA